MYYSNVLKNKNCLKITVLCGCFMELTTSSSSIMFTYQKQFITLLILLTLHKNAHHGVFLLTE